jgi:hypothetical protein
MKDTVPTALVLTVFLFIISSFAALASDGHRYHAHRSALVYVPCTVFHFHVVELRHYRVLASSFRPAYYCGWLWEPNPSDLDSSSGANSNN